jgi:CheY-like chemotaxis protein
MSTVLFADADRELRDACRQFLSRHGFQVDAAADGLECLAKLRRTVPDLLILDLELPWGGGDGVLGLLREEPRKLPNRVVLTSAIAAIKVLGNFVAAPVVQVLAKPFALSTLLESASSVSPIAPAHSSIGRQRRGILVVDDEPGARDLLQTHLQREGFHVWTVGSGEDALYHCCDHAEEIAVVLQDIQMPEIDGRQTLEGIQALDIDIPICFITGTPGGFEPSDLLRQGARHLLGKAFRLDEIVCVVRRLATDGSGQLQQS